MARRALPAVGGTGQRHAGFSPLESGPQDDLSMTVGGQNRIGKVGITPAAFPKRKQENASRKFFYERFIKQKEGGRAISSVLVTPNEFPGPHAAPLRNAASPTVNSAPVAELAQSSDQRIEGRESCRNQRRAAGNAGETISGTHKNQDFKQKPDTKNFRTPLKSEVFCGASLCCTGGCNYFRNSARRRAPVRRDGG